MLFQKKNPSVGALGFFHTKHKEGTPVVSPIVAQHGHKSNGSSVSVENKVVLTGIDTLVITAGGNVSPSKWLINQQQIWNQYQQDFDYATDEFLCDEINGSWFSIKPYGMKQYKYVLDNPEIGHIRVWNPDKWSTGALAKQHIYIDFRSSWLHQQSPDTLEQSIIDVAGVFFDYNDPRELNIQISRVDLHTDVTNGSSFLSESQIKNTITRSKYRNYFVEDDVIKLSADEKDLLEGAPYYNKGTQKLIPVELVDKLMMIANNQLSIGVDNVVHKREIETAYFGKKKSDVWGKVYDKTKCCKVKSDLDTPLLWVENGWNKTDRVIRVEFSMRRAFIKEMDNGKYVSLGSFITNMNNIWEWMTTKWMRMVDEVKKNNIQLSPISKFWSIIQSAFTTATTNIIRKRNYQGKVNQLIKQGIGCLTQAVAKGMRNNEDIGFTEAVGTAVKKVLLSSYHSGEIHSRRVMLGVA